MDPPGLIPARPWTWLRQVHGPRVVTVTSPGEHAGQEADAAVTAVPGCSLLVRTADCAPVVFVADDVVGIAHAGWKGLEAGVIDATVEAMHELGAERMTAYLGPCIGPECYEFGAADLDRLALRFGPEVRALTATGRPALDLRAAVRAALTAHEIPCLPGRIVPATGEIPCPSCEPEHYFSYRARADRGRQASLVELVWSDR